MNMPKIMELTNASRGYNFDKGLRFYASILKYYKSFIMHHSGDDLVIVLANKDIMKLTSRKNGEVKRINDRTYVFIEAYYMTEKDGITVLDKQSFVERFIGDGKTVHKYCPYTLSFK